MDDVWGAFLHHPLHFEQHALEDAGMFCFWAVKKTTTQTLPTKQLLYGSDKPLYIYNTLPETSIAPENGWLEDDPFLLGFGSFSGDVSFKEGMFPFFSSLFFKAPQKNNPALDIDIR